MRYYFPGRKKSIPVCISIDKGIEKDVDSSKCKFLPKPDIVRRRCNYHCKLEWRIATRGECSEPCGFGLQNITHRCHKIMHDSSVATLLDTYCMRELSSKPESSMPCEGLCEGVQWSFGEWGACSQTCGIGHQTRSVRCHHQKSGRDMKDEKCGTKNESLTRRQCNLGACPSWEVAEWSACSVSCGIGISERKYWCTLKERQLDRRRCNEMTIPHHRKECFVDSKCGRWRTGQWSPCSSNCGPGVRTREVACVNSQTDIEIKDSNCDEENKPGIESACVELSCQEDDDVSDEDSETDNDYEKEDEKDGATAKMDATSKRHRHTQSRESRRKRRRHQYNLPRYRWKIGRWDKCSKKCGGVQSRVVACYDRVKGRLETDQSRCSKVRPRPRDSQSCKSDCLAGVWKLSNWSLCSSSCGSGVRWRNVECYNKITNEIVNTETCSEQKKPRSEEECIELESCPRPVLQVKMKQIEQDRQNFSWREGDWGSCSATCGGGTKSRQVECLNMDGKKMDHDHCDIRTKPQNQDICNQEPCPAWNFGGWGQCDKPCDGGVSQRLVRCQDHLGQTLPDARCNTSTRPLDTRSCNSNTCNTFRRRRYLWKVGKWAQVIKYHQHRKK